jgi:hypothetical protein
VGPDAGPPLCSPDVAAPEVKNVTCTVTIASPGLQEPASKHIPDGTPIQYCTNPPTSGPHSPIWADYKEYQNVVPWPNLVHSEEHGGVLLLYKCDAADPACTAIVEQLRQVAARAPVDPTCETQGRPGTKRIVIAPSTTIPSRVAASAWGAYLTADCVDGPTMDDFVATKGKKGPEDLCFAGQATF